jgi:AAA domain, putative AbiEii toxin, Type IV TA system/Overcoming lysogenization defect protein-like, TOPRIM domain
VRVGLSSLTLQDGSSVELADPGVTIVVGPNNSGKTLLLREIVNRLAQEGQPTEPLRILSAVKVRKEGSADELVDWLKEQGFAHQRDPRTSYQTSYRRRARPLTETNVRALWDRPDGLGALHDFLVEYHDTGSRLQLLGGASLPNLYSYDETSRSPLHALYSDRNAMAELSALAERAFDMPLTLNRYSAGLRLHIGVPSVPETLPPPSRAYLDAVLSLPLLEEQGDGVRSFVGLLLHSLVRLPLVLIDEPEDFLHPPHARLLGRVLVERTPADGQLIIATHSDDLLQGVLEVRDRPIRVIRLTREGDHAIMRTLDPEAIRALWADPLLRHSQLLDGLFHDAVLICEGDADCRYYAAIFDELIGNEFSPSLHITHCGGKQRLAKAARALIQFGVHVGVIADLDMLENWKMLADLVEALGGSRAAFERDHRVVAANVANLGRAPETSELRGQLNDLLRGRTGKLDTETADKARRLLAVRSGWQEIKRGGLASLPSGDAARAAKRLLGSLAELGLFLVPVGELERWVTTVGGQSSEWVSSVLEGNHHLPLSPERADFGRRVLDYLGDSVAALNAGS